MTSVQMLFDITFFIISVYISYKAIRRYFLESVNFENIYYWGLSFAITAILFLLELVSGIITIDYKFNIALKIGNVLVVWLQLFAISLSIFCKHTCFNKHYPMICLVCNRKKVRVYMWILMLLIISIFLSVWFMYDGSLVGYYKSIILFDLVCIFMLALLVIFLFRTINYHALRVAFTLMLLSYLQNMIYYFMILNKNIALNPLISLEWGLKAAALLFIFYSVYDMTESN